MVPHMYERLRTAIIGLCAIAIGVAVFEPAIAVIALAALLAVVIVVGIASWVIRGGSSSNAERPDPPA